MKSFGIKWVYKIFFSELPRLSLRPLSEFRQSVHFDKTHEIDETALILQLGLPTEFIPIKYSGAGDWLFKAISQSLYGTKDYHQNLRLLYLDVAKQRNCCPNQRVF